MCLFILIHLKVCIKKRIYKSSILHLQVFTVNTSVCAHRAISGVNGFVSPASICINKLSVDEQLMGHVHCHVVDLLLHLWTKTNSQNVFFSVVKTTTNTVILKDKHQHSQH